VVDSIGADLAIVTEAPASAAADGLRWFGHDGARNGTTIVTTPEWSVEKLPCVRNAPCVNAVRVTGPQVLTVLLVWTWPTRAQGNYRVPLVDGLRAYRHLPGPFVIAGDFNGNVCFDRPGSRLKWSNCFRAVEEFGVVSAYHEYFDEPFGEETRWTQYQLRKEDWPFHLDYVFVPRDWKLVDVRVPVFNEFTTSDHRPVIVDVDTPRLSRN
jgi:exodeoxyribonuclease-3